MSSNQVTVTLTADQWEEINNLVSIAIRTGAPFKIKAERFDGDKECMDAVRAFWETTGMEDSYH